MNTLFLRAEWLLHSCVNHDDHTSFVEYGFKIMAIKFISSKKRIGVINSPKLNDLLVESIVATILILRATFADEEFLI